MATNRDNDAKWRQIILSMEKNRGTPSKETVGLAIELGLWNQECAFHEVVTRRFPSPEFRELWWHITVDAAHDLGIETPKDAKESSDVITCFLDNEGYTRLEGESVAARTIRIIQEAEQRAAAGKCVNSGE